MSIKLTCRLDQLISTHFQQFFTLDKTALIKFRKRPSNYIFTQTHYYPATKYHDWDGMARMGPVSGGTRIPRQTLLRIEPRCPPIYMFAHKQPTNWETSIFQSCLSCAFLPNMSITSPFVLIGSTLDGCVRACRIGRRGTWKVPPCPQFPAYMLLREDNVSCRRCGIVPDGSCSPVLPDMLCARPAAYVLSPSVWSSSIFRNALWLSHPLFVME